VAYLLVIG
jgi:hypothetical protein